MAAPGTVRIPIRAELDDIAVADLREAIAATRSVLKSHMRSARTALQFLADLEEKLEAASHSPGRHSDEHDPDRHGRSQ